MRSEKKPARRTAARESHGKWAPEVRLQAAQAVVDRKTPLLSVAQALERGDNVAVYYSSENPGTATLRDPRRAFHEDLMGFGVLCGIIGIAGTIVAARASSVKAANPAR
jgi:hypothetical protein